MGKYFEAVKNVPLFKDITEAEIDSLMGCLGPKVRSYAKSETILQAGQPAELMGIVIAGGAQVIDDDIYGNRTILTDVGETELFSEAFCFAGNQTMPVSIIAVSDCKVMFIDCRKIVSPCASACIFHKRLISNMLEILAAKNVVLNRKIEHLSKRRTRDKLLSYLSAEAKKQGSMRFEIPYNRQEMADYLCVDRSALSSELGKMRDEGILSFQQNMFELFDD